jgi:hypothetical protein
MPGARTRRQTHRPTASPRKKRFAQAGDQANGDRHGRGAPARTRRRRHAGEKGDLHPRGDQAAQARRRAR